jgi:hypothetical protein
MKAHGDRAALAVSLTDGFYTLDLNRIGHLADILKTITQAELNVSTKNKTRVQALIESLSKIKFSSKNSWDRGSVAGKGVNFEWVEKRFKTGKACCKVVITYLELLIAEVERYGILNSPFGS